MDDDKNDWSEVEHSVQRRNINAALPVQPAQAFRGGLRDPKGEEIAVTGMIAQFKANKISKNAALSYLKEFHTRQLEVARHQLSEVGRAQTAASTAMTEQFLEHLNSQQLRFLQEIGLKNLEAKFSALKQLGDQVSGSLKQLTASDWPPSVRQQMIDGVMTLQSKFFDKLMTDLGEKR